MPETRDTQPPEPPKPSAGASSGRPVNLGVVLVFGEKDPRIVRCGNIRQAYEEAERQRYGGEPITFYEGADYRTELRRGATPALVVERGQSIEDARKQARQP